MHFDFKRGFALFGFLIWLCGCALFEGAPRAALGAPPQEKVFYAPYDEVWRAAQLALQTPFSYPLRINNLDAGVLETEQIKGAQGWRPAHQSDPHSSGYSYKIVVRVIKGSLGRQRAFKVSVHKEASLQRDFFAQPEPVPSDGMEERVLLYRIERELGIDRAIRRTQKIKNQKTQ